MYGFDESEDFLVKFHPDLIEEVYAIPNFTKASDYKSTDKITFHEVGRVEVFRFVGSDFLPFNSWTLELDKQ